MQFTVKNEFLERCPNPNDCDIEQLVSFNLKNFLHNENGPAVIYFKDKFPPIVYEILSKNSYIYLMNENLCTNWVNGKNFGKSWA